MTVPTHLYEAGGEGDAAPLAAHQDEDDKQDPRLSSEHSHEVSINTKFEQDHCYHDKAFMEVEASRRAANIKNTQQLLFVSHCWRDPSMQLRKRLIVAHLSKPVEEGGGGHAYWADWLDLQAQGPVPWRSEVEEGIAKCSKFVALVDAGWLCSYNCLQELALAFAHRKPVVIIVLSQEAWELLTVPGGAEIAMAAANKQHLTRGPSSAGTVAKSLISPSSVGIDIDCDEAVGSEDGSPTTSDTACIADDGTKVCDGPSQNQAAFARWLATPMGPELPHPNKRNLGRRDTDCSLASAADSCWSSSKHGVPLFSYRGQEIIPGKPLSKFVVQDLFMRMSSINLCPAREMDETVRGMDGMLEMVGQYVEKDLDYHKEHTELKNFAVRWDAAGRGDRNLVQHKEALRWDRWLDAARSAHKEPEPTKLQEEFVSASLRHYARRRRIAQAVAVVFATLLVVAAVVCGYLAMSSSRARDIALQAEGMARASEAKALASEAVAELRALEAREEARVSRLMSMRMLSMTALGMIDLTNKDNAMSWELKTVYAVLSRLATGPGTLSVAANALNVARTLLGMDIDIPMQTVRVEISDPSGAGNPVECYNQGSTTYSLPEQGKVVIPCTDGVSKALLIYTLRPDGTVDDDQPAQTIRYTAQANTTVAGALVSDLHPQIAAYSPNGKYIVATVEQEVHLWPVLPDGTIDPPFVTSPQILAGHEGYVSYLWWSPDGRYLASTSTDGVLKIWAIPADRSTGLSPFCTDTLKIAERNCRVTWSPVGWHVAVDCERGGISVWKVLQNGTADPSSLQDVPDSWSMNANVAGWSPNGKLLAAGDVSGTVKIWAMSSNGSGTLEGPVERFNFGTGIWVLTNTFSPDGRTLAVSGYGHPVLKLFGILPEGTLDPNFKMRMLTGPTNPFRAVRWSPSGTEIMTTTLDSSVRMWDARLPGEPGRRGEVDKENLDQDLEVGKIVQDVSYCRKHWFLAAGSSNGNISVWATLPGGKVDHLSKQVLTGHTESVRSVVWSPSGLYLASSSADLTIRLWRHNHHLGMMDPMPLQVVQSGHTGRIQSLSWSPDGTLLASGSLDNSMEVWAVDPSNGTVPIRGINGTHPQVLEHEATVDSVAFSPSGRHLACGCRDSTVWVWNIAPGGTEIDTGSAQVLKGHTSWAYSVSWSPDGRYLASGSMDYTIRIWPVSLVDSKIGAPQVLTTSVTVWSVAWSPSGDQLAMGGSGSSLAVWTRHNLPDEGDGIFHPEATATIAGQSHTVTAVNWHPTGNGWIASANYGGTVKVQRLLSVDDMRVLFHNTWPQTNWTLSDDEVVASGIPSEILSFPESSLKL